MEFATVSSRFWIGETGRRIIQAGPDVVVVAFYLLTNQHANVIGLYYMPTDFIAKDTNLRTKDVARALEFLIPSFCQIDENASVVFVRKMAKYQLGESLRKLDRRVIYVNRIFQALPASPLLSEWLELYGQKYHVKARFVEDMGGADSTRNVSPLEGPSKGLKGLKGLREPDKTVDFELAQSLQKDMEDLREEWDPEKNQDLENQENTPQPPPLLLVSEPVVPESESAILNDLFARFWISAKEIYGKTSPIGAKDEAKKEFLKLKPKPGQVDHWLAVMQAQENGRRERQARDGWAAQFKHLCRWLKYRQFDDPSVAGQVPAAPRDYGEIGL